MSTHQQSMMEPAVVRYVSGEPNLSIAFALDGNNKNMLRDPTEELGKVLARIAISTAKDHNGTARKSKRNKAQQQKQPTKPPVVNLFYNDELVPEGVMNSQAWLDGATLHVGEVKYAVQRNPPTFTTAVLPTCLLAGFPVCPKLEVEFGHLEECEFTWYTAGEDSVDIWRVAGRERVYIPSNLDIGLRLRLCCTPKDGDRRGKDIELVSTATVEAGPAVCTFDNRHTYTQKGQEIRVLRVVSYNILADVYTQTEQSKTTPLYSYCAPHALEVDYRQNLIRKELVGYNADVICLQEVDKRVFIDSLAPSLHAFGLDGVFKEKRKQHEGLSMFYRRSRLRLLSSHDIILSEALTSDPLHSDLLKKLSTDLKKRTSKKGSALQVSVFEVLKEPSRKICVANTHLYWHPKGGNVRLVQIIVALRHLRHVIDEVTPCDSLVFAGDFNSTPNSSLFRLLTQGEVPLPEDWGSGGQKKACPPVVSSPFPPLRSACGEPAYTNYIEGFQGCLDYIFTEPDKMVVEQVIPLPSHEEVTAHQALPSVSHPSDHIALVCDLRWKP